jgi:hypothetical protein
MDHALAEQLKDAGFPQTHSYYGREFCVFCIEDEDTGEAVGAATTAVQIFNGRTGTSTTPSYGNGARDVGREGRGREISLEGARGGRQTAPCWWAREREYELGKIMLAGAYPA